MHGSSKHAEAPIPIPVLCDPDDRILRSRSCQQAIMVSHRLEQLHLLHSIHNHSQIGWSNDSGNIMYLRLVTTPWSSNVWLDDCDDTMQYDCKQKKRHNKKLTSPMFTTNFISFSRSFRRARHVSLKCFTHRYGCNRIAPM